LVSTNTALSSWVGGNQTGGTSGRTAKTANGFYYALLVGDTYGSPAPSTNVLLDWDTSFLGMYATNMTATAGGVRGQGGSSGTTIVGWGAPTGSSYTTAEDRYFILVGWSSNLGNSWTTVSNKLSTGNWQDDGLFGVSRVGHIYSAGPPGPPWQNMNIFGGAPDGLTEGFTLYHVPEPSALALAGLGGFLLWFRRRRE
jgi:hypothetical protein